MKKTVAMLEKERKRALIPFFVMCAFIALAPALWQFSVPASVMSAVVGVLVNVVCGGRMRKKYVSAYNSVSRGMLLEQTYGGIDFDPSRGFSEKEVASAGIMKPWNGFDSLRLTANGRYTDTISPSDIPCWCGRRAFPPRK